MNSHNYGIIMAGGGGTMFWPLCRKDSPQQFLAIEGLGKSFLRHTYERMLGIVPPENILVVTLARYKDAVLRNIPELRPENLLLEPYGRNTAPCIAYAAYSLLKRDPQAVMAVTPADNLIDGEQAYRDTLREALDYAAAHDSLITLGIVPDKPDTNFGYIQVVGGEKAWEQTRPVKVKTFTEKPDEALAEVFLQSGEFLWNSGIFVWKAETIRRELETHCSEVTAFFVGWERVFGTPDEKAFIERAYAGCPKVSLDYGILEKTDKAWLYPTDFGWHDIGSWDAYYNFAPKDRHGNVVRAGRTLFSDTSGNLLLDKTGRKLFAFKGLQNYMVIDAGDVLLICPRDDKAFKDFISDIAMPEYEAFR